MPNHITNYMNVTGPVKDVRAFQKAVSSDNPELRAHNEKEYKATIEHSKAVLEKNPNDFMAKHNLSNAEEGLKNLDTEKYVLDFNGTVPMPIEIRNTTKPAQTDKEKKQQEENTKKYGYPNWYDWACACWGTKWGAYDIGDVSEEVLQSGELRLHYRFDTAWSPPWSWLEKTSELYPSLKFVDAWHDEGGGAGQITAQAGDYENEQMEDHEWFMEYDGNYREAYEFITEGEYNEVIDEYTDKGNCDYGSHERALLERIQDKDLPLFLSFEWYEVSDEYEERCKNCRVPVLKEMKFENPNRRIQW